MSGPEDPLARGGSPNLTIPYAEKALHTIGPIIIAPRHKTNTCRKKSWGIHFCANACGACIRTHANTGKLYLRDHFPHISQILEGIHFGANTCRACIRTRANTGKYSWRIIYVLVSCQGVHCTQKFSQKSSTYSTVHQTMFFHCCSSRSWGAQCHWTDLFTLHQVFF